MTRPRTTYNYVFTSRHLEHNFSRISNSRPPEVAAQPAYSAVTSFGAVQLEWPPSMGATAYKVARGTSPAGPFSDIASPTTNSATDQGLTMGATHYYVVRALGPTGHSGNSPVTTYVAKKYIPLG